MNHQCLPHVETSELICVINQLTGFCVMRSLFVDGLGRIFLPNKIEKRFQKGNTNLTFIWVIQEKFTKNIEIWMPKDI